MHTKLYAGRHVHAKFHACRQASSLDIVAGEKKKDKSTEKYNITPDFEKFHFYKNGNIKRQTN